MAVVWVKHGEDAAVRVPLSDPSKLPVSAIAGHWGLDSASLRVGNLALTTVSDGSSLLSIDSLRTLLDPGLGDGSSCDRPLVICGRKPPTCTVCQDEVTKWEAFKEFTIRNKLLADIDREMSRECATFWQYTSELKRVDRDKIVEVFEAKVSPFVATVHVLGEGEKATKDNYTGMAGLVRPDGSCVTAVACCGDGDLTANEKLVVVFSRRGQGVQYECKVANVRNGVALLEPRAGSMDLGACLMCHYSGDSIYCFSAPVLAFGWSYNAKDGSVSASPGLRFETKSYMPATKPSDFDLGAPVITPQGVLLGVVVRHGNPSDLRRFKRECKMYKGKVTVPTETLMKEGLKHCEFAFFELCTGVYTSVYEDWEKVHSTEPDDAEIARLMAGEDIERECKRIKKAYDMEGYDWRRSLPSTSS